MLLPSYRPVHIVTNIRRIVNYRDICSLENKFTRNFNFFTKLKLSFSSTPTTFVYGESQSDDKRAIIEINRFHANSPSCSLSALRVNFSILFSPIQFIIIHTIIFSTVFRKRQNHRTIFAIRKGNSIIPIVLTNGILYHSSRYSMACRNNLIKRNNCSRDKIRENRILARIYPFFILAFIARVPGKHTSVACIATNNVNFNLRIFCFNVRCIGRSFFRQHRA